MPRCDFNKFAYRTSAWVLSVNLLDIFRTPFPKITSGGLLLIFEILTTGTKKILTIISSTFLIT